MHVFGPPTRYPPAQGARYTLPEATAHHYQATAAALGLYRAVLVQPSFYGSDNRCLLDTLATGAGRYRGVAIASPEADMGLMRRWHQQGVRGLRLDLFMAQAQGRTVQDILAGFRASCATAAELGWSVDLYVPGKLCLALLPAFDRLPCPVSVAHMGYLVPNDTLSDTACQEFVDAARSSGTWVKLTGSYRYGQDAGRQRARWLAQMLLDAMPHRLLWGSDWPHVMAAPQNSGALLAEFLELCLDERQRQQILVDNPARLYDFMPSPTSGRPGR